MLLEFYEFYLRLNVEFGEFELGEKILIRWCISERRDHDLSAAFD